MHEKTAKIFQFNLEDQIKRHWFVKRMERIHLKERKHPLAHDQTWKWGAEDTCAILIFENRNMNSFINCEVICKAFFFFMIQEDDAEMHILDN